MVPSTSKPGTNGTEYNTEYIVCGACPEIHACSLNMGSNTGGVLRRYVQTELFTMYTGKNNNY